MLSPIEAGVIAALLLLFVGSKKLPDAARAVGRVPGELRRGHREADPDDE